MANNYYIKAYYTKQNQQQPEIRRFTIDISPENDVYHELHTKIASYQPNNQLNEITLQYNDEDNERITFSSNEELRSAISLNKDTNTLKVFVTFNQSIPQPPPQQQQQQQDTTNKECHVGVECDGCKGPVIGFRYKCFVCPNYDLCEKCSSAGIHSEHNMIKITKPGNFNDLHHHHHHHSHGRRHHHRHTPPPHFPPFVSNPDFLQQIQAQIPQWLPNRENATHFRTHMQQHLDSLKANAQTHMQNSKQYVESVLKTNVETHMPNSKQYLESVGQYLQQVLSPFGIDCDYHVDEHKSTTNEKQEEPVATTTQQEEQVPTMNQQQDEQVPIIDSVPILEPSAVPKYPDLTVINNNNQEQTAGSLPPPPPAPQVEESTKITNPLEKAIDDCMERMQGMGFMDANGALRELIRSKNGDINLVLDAINPRHFHP